MTSEPAAALIALADPLLFGYRLSEITAWVLLGLIAGAVARRVMPGEEKGGVIITIILGILGAVVGGWIGRNVGFLPSADPGHWLPSLHSLLTATVGALIVLALWKWLRA